MGTHKGMDCHVARILFLMNGKQNIIPCFDRRGLSLIDSVANGWANSNRPLLQGLQIANASRRTLSLPRPDVSTEKARKKREKLQRSTVLAQNQTQLFFLKKKGKNEIKSKTIAGIGEFPQAA